MVLGSQSYTQYNDSEHIQITLQNLKNIDQFISLREIHCDKETLSAKHVLLHKPPLCFLQSHPGELAGWQKM